MNPFRIVIVDDHPLFRKGLKNILASLDVIETVGLADHFDDLKTICKKESVDLVLMDADLGDACGAETTFKIKQLFPKLKVLALSAHDNKQYIYKMIEAGASGYVLKNAEIEELAVAIKMVAEGNSYFSSSISKQLVQFSPQNKKEERMEEKLTLRELEILKFIIQNEWSNKEIANHLFISPRTVETHKRNLIQKLQVKNTIGLAKYYFQHSVANS